MDQFFVPRLIMRYRVRRIVSKASKCLINWERKKLGVSGTLASIKMKGMYNWSVFSCTRMRGHGTTGVQDFRCVASLCEEEVQGTATVERNKFKQSDL